jgi:hypothetical protein
MKNTSENPEAWSRISAREKWQIINGSVLVFAAILLYFVSFAITLTIGMGTLSAGATMLATGLAFFGITSYIKTSLSSYETRIDRKLDEIEKKEKSS